MSGRNLAARTRRRIRPGPETSPGYDAFLSYSHSADVRLAPALRRCLQSMAKPWYRTRSARIFQPTPRSVPR